MYQGIIDWFKKNIVSEEINGKDILEVGSLDVNGSVRPYIESLKSNSYIGMDMVEGNKVDLVLDANNILKYFGSKKFDVVICTEMLEHVYDWRTVINNMKGVLKSNGYIYLTVCPYEMIYHPHPKDYWRFTVDDMNKIFKDFQIIKVESDTFIKVKKIDKSKMVDLSLINIKPVMRTLIILTGVKEFILKRLLPSLRDYYKGNYQDDILIINYGDMQSFDFNDDRIILYNADRKYNTFTADRFRVFTEALKECWKNYDVIMHIDGNDIEFFKSIQPLLDMGAKEICCVEEPHLDKVRVNSLCLTNNKWETIGTLPVDYWEAIRDKPIIGCGMFLGPAESMYGIVKFLSKYIEADSRFGSDQLMLNVLFWYYKVPFKVVSSEWAFEYYYGCQNLNGKYFYSDKDGKHEIAIMHYTGDGFPFKRFEGRKEEDVIIETKVDPKIAINIVTPDIMNERFIKCYRALKDNNLTNYTIEIVECHINEEIFDYVRNTNMMLKGIDADYYIFLNSDCYVDKNTIKELIETAKQDSNIGIVGGLQFKLDGSICGSAGILNKDLFPTANSTTKEELYKQKDCLWVNGALMLVTKACKDKIGVFDETLKLYFTDVEYGVRAWDNGFRVVYQPKAKAIHEEGAYRRAYITKYNIDEKGRLLLKNGKWKNLNVDKLNKKVSDSNKLHYHMVDISTNKGNIERRKDRHYKLKFPC